MIDIDKLSPFLMGIGGSGMSSIAHIFLDMGMQVYGYDKSDSLVVQSLKNRGAIIYSSPESISDYSVFGYGIYSSAIRKDKHPLYLTFSKQNIPLYHRSEILHSLFKKKRSIAVAGSHGKTTTTTMIAYILYSLHQEPGVMIGGEPPFLENRGGYWGKGEWGVFESDESDGTFLNYKPEIKIVTNIDNDHLDYYKTEDQLVRAFSEFIKNTEDTKTILNYSALGIQKALSYIENKKGILGFQEEDPLIQFYDDKIIFKRENKQYQLEVPFPGKHYLLNAYISLLACEQIGLKTEDILAALKKYPGVKRRMEFLGEWNGVKVYDDYGHHPTEIKAVIQAIHSIPNKKKCIVLFQPHRYTRTKELYKEFAEVLSIGDSLLLLPIYSAGEDPIQGIDSKLIFDLAKTPNKILLSGDIQKDLEVIKSIIQSGDILLSIGAGNVRSWGEKLTDV